MSDKYTFIQEYNDPNNSRIEVTFEEDACTEICRKFKDFLTGCGFQPESIANSFDTIASEAEPKRD